MRLTQATMQAAKQRWNKYTRSVICPENRSYLKTHTLMWAHDRHNRTPVAGVIQNGRFCPLYWFYLDQTDYVTFASSQWLKLEVRP